MHTGLTIVTFIIMIVGLAGVLLPFLPGVPLAWIGLFIYAYGTGFAVISLKVTLVFLALTLLSIALEIVLPILGAKTYHATRYGLIGATIGLFAGIFIFGPLGLILGPFLGAILGELLAGRGKHAIRSGVGTFIGFMLSLALRLGLVLVMMGYVIAALIHH